MVDGKTIRKNLVLLDDAIILNAQDTKDQTNDRLIDLGTDESKLKTMQSFPGSEMDRYMIAFLRLQTEGRVAYRRLLGMHGGGFGTSQDKNEIQTWESKGKTKSSRPLMMVKADLDKEQIILEDWDSKHNTQNSDDNGEWPSPQNNVNPTKPKEGEEYLAHIFCWHGQSPFISWHRPFMVEFERLLQDYDPLFPSAHEGCNALGAHYYDWNGWDGMVLPPFINYPTYKIKTPVFSSVLAGMESYNQHDQTITNPLYRWFAPMLPQHQLNETFPSDVPNNENCTTREPALSDISGSLNFEYPFPKNDMDGVPSIETSIRQAMGESDYLAFCTTTHNGKNSIENGHNLFHNRVGGSLGTMSPLQSSFDPIFFLHHSNVERLFMSWQRVWTKRGGKTSLPPKWLMETRLYPWTKPDLVKKGSLSWNTEADINHDGNAAEKTVNDATVQDWWNYEELEYEYDEYVPVTKPLKKKDWLFGKSVVLMTVWAPVLTSGPFDLCLSNGDGQVTIDSVSLIIGNNPSGSATTTCSQCQKRSHLTLVYDVTGFVTPYDLVYYNSQLTKPVPEVGNSVINNLFVRHKGERYAVNDPDPSMSITVRSVRESKAHMKAIRKELKKRHETFSKKDNNGPKWSCLS